MSKNSKEGEFTVRYDTKDIMHKLELIDEKLNSVVVQTTKTNGRVSASEASIVRLRTILYSTIGTLVTTGISIIVYLGIN